MVWSSSGGRSARWLDRWSWIGPSFLGFRAVPGLRLEEHHDHRSRGPDRRGGRKNEGQRLPSVTRDLAGGRKSWIQIVRADRGQIQRSRGSGRSIVSRHRWAGLEIQQVASYLKLDLRLVAVPIHLRGLSVVPNLILSGNGVRWEVRVDWSSRSLPVVDRSFIPWDLPPCLFQSPRPGPPFPFLALCPTVASVGPKVRDEAVRWIQCCSTNHPFHLSQNNPRPLIETRASQTSGELPYRLSGIGPPVDPETGNRKSKQVHRVCK